MKKLYLFLLLGIIACNLFCQQDNEMVLDSTFQYDWDSDSSEWILEDRRVYTYDANGNLISEEILRHSLNWHPQNLYLDYHKLNSYTYDAYGKRTELIRYEWNSYKNDWVKDWKEKSSYDSNGNLTEIVSYHWDNQWILTHKHLYTYDANGNLTEHLDLDYHVVFVEGDEKEVWSYDANGNQLEYISYAWKSGINDWVLDKRELNTYDSNGNIIEEIKYDWDSEVNEWIGTILIWRPPWVGGRKVFTYDTVGKLIEEVIYSWDAESNSWSLFKEYDEYEFMGVARRFVNQYDDYDNLVEKISYRWEPDSSAWVLAYPWSERSVYTNDANGNLSEEITYAWDPEIDDWRKEQKEDSFWSVLDIDTVAIPDTAFLYALIEEGVDTNGDSLISYTEAEAITELDIEGYTGGGCGDIADLTGIEAFVNLDTLVLVRSSLSKLDLSNNTALKYLSVGENGLTEINISSCTELSTLILSKLVERCGNNSNKLATLDISNNPKLTYIWMVGMPTLFEVCVWTMPFPPEGVEVLKLGSPNVNFTTGCSDFEVPYITASDSHYQPDFIEATSSVNGMIYLVPENTERDIAEIRGALIDSVEAVSNTAVKVSLSGLFNGVYWLYARDSAGNISEPAVFEILGVGFEDEMAGHFRFYPNPTSGLLTIETSVYDLHSIEISSLNGQMMYRTNMDGSSLQIDFSSFSKGVYFITIRSRNFVRTEKIIKL